LSRKWLFVLYPL